MTPLSLREWLLVRFGLASPALRARAVNAAWHGGRPSPAVLAVQSLIAALVVVVPCLSMAWLCLPGIAALQGITTFSRAADSLRSGSRTPTQGDAAGRRPEEYGELLPEATRLEIQRRHDRWQKAFGDRPYREQLKPMALAKALDAYLSEAYRGNLGLSPEAFLARLTPEDIRRFTAAAERDWAASARE